MTRRGAHAVRMQCACHAVHAVAHHEVAVVLRAREDEQWLWRQLHAAHLWKASGVGRRGRQGVWERKGLRREERVRVAGGGFAVVAEHAAHLGLDAPLSAEHGVVDPAGAPHVLELADWGAGVEAQVHGDRA